ncbi:hypothetical protein MTR67_053039, partial [Solanum verrucosum]
FRYPGSASCTSLIQLSTPESVVSLLAFQRTQLFCVLSFCFIRMLRGLSQHPSQYFRGFIDRQSARGVTSCGTNGLEGVDIWERKLELGFSTGGGDGEGVKGSLEAHSGRREHDPIKNGDR